MPPTRMDASAFAYKPFKRSEHNALQPHAIKGGRDSQKDGAEFLVETFEKQQIFYPTTPLERAAYRTSGNKVVTSHQWAVYDFVRTIPVGRVTTYKDVSAAVGGSPRSVGNALRNNPFAPYIPCHRVIASNLFVGGFFGEWGPNDKTGTRCNQKLDLLVSEGLTFTKNGNLNNADHTLWRGGGG